MIQRIDIKPQPGPQEQFLATPADIAIFGGGAGGGKTYGLLLEPLRHTKNPDFDGVIFRKTTPQVRNKGGLWDESTNIYPLLNAKPREHILEWQFPAGSCLKFNHLEYDKNVYDHQGAQYAFIGFDELTHFSEFQFFYLLSRNRSTCGIRPYIRAGCNPDPDSWVARFISWWVDQKTGYAIKGRAGVLRWFIRRDNTLVWADTKEELISKHGEKQQPKSVTFIPASIYDNKILMQKDPSYLSNLMALPLVERGRLLDCNWKIRPAAGNIFKRTWFKTIDILPSDLVNTIRYWDLAATEPNKVNKNPDWTAGCKMAKTKDGLFIWIHQAHFRNRPLETEKLIRKYADEDGPKVKIMMEQEPGSAGVNNIDHYSRQVLQGYDFRALKTTGSKILRAGPLSAQAERGNVMMLRGAWNQTALDELEMFGDESCIHDDIADSASGSYYGLIHTVPAAMGVSPEDADENVYRLRGRY